MVPSWQPTAIKLESGRAAQHHTQEFCSPKIEKIKNIIFYFLKYHLNSNFPQKPTFENGLHVKSAFPVLVWTSSRGPWGPYGERSLSYGSLGQVHWSAGKADLA